MARATNQTSGILPAAECRARRGRPASLSSIIPPRWLRAHAALDLRPQVSGLDRLPARRFILAANHTTTSTDLRASGCPPSTSSSCARLPREPTASAVSPEVGSINRSISSGPIQAPSAALRASSRAASSDLPRRPFSREGRLVSGQPGVAMIALRAGCPSASRSAHLRGAGRRRFYIPRSRPSPFASASR